MDLKNLKGKTVLVTGGARRLGRDIVLGMARAGADVCITYRESKRDAAATIAEVEALGVRGLAVECDVRHEASVRKAVQNVIRKMGGIDVLVNNAAVYETVRFDALTAEDWTRVFESNVRGPYLVMQASLESLRERKGRIINMGSLGGVSHWTSHAHYCTSKAALHHLSRIMAKALAPEIAVNCVAPGMIELDEAPKGASKGSRERSAEFFGKQALRTPMGKNGTAADVTSAVMFFATAPHFITGQLLLVDGGLDLV